MRTKSQRLGLWSGLMFLLTSQLISGCGDAVSDSDSPSAGGSAASDGGTTSDGGAPSGGGPASGGAAPSDGGAPATGSAGGGPSDGGANFGGLGGMGGDSVASGGEPPSGIGGYSGINCPAQLPEGDCELGETFSCQGYIYPYVTPFCDCVESTEGDPPQWTCAL